MALATTLGIPTIFSFALTVHFSIRHVGINGSIMLGTASWLVVGALVLFIKSQLS